MPHLHLTRTHAILHLKRRLEQDSIPRIQMSLIVGLTGAAGLLFSNVLLQPGETCKTLRETAPALNMPTGAL